MRDGAGAGLELAIDDHVEPPTITVAGELDLSVADRLQLAVADVAARHPGAGLALDLDGLRFMDSTGLGVLLAASRRVAPARLVLRRASQPVLRLLEVAGCTDLFDLEP